MIKKLLFLITFALLGTSLVAQKNNSNFSYGIKAGVNLANIYSSDLPIEEFTKNKIGFHGGIVTEYRFNSLFALQTELLYSQQGTKSDINYVEIEPPGELEPWGSPANNNSQTTLYENLNSTGKYNYINLPVLAKMYVYKGLNIVAGPQVSFLVSAKDEIPNSRDLDVKDQLDSVDFGLNGGVGYQSNFGVFVSANYYLGLNNVSAYNYENLLGFDFDLHQGVWQFSLGYKF